MFNKAATSPRGKQLSTQLQIPKPSLQSYNVIDSDLRSPTTPRHHEMLHFPQTPRHIYSHDQESNNPRARFPRYQMIYDSENTSQFTCPSTLTQDSRTSSSFEAYKQHFFSMYRFSMSPRSYAETPKVTNGDVEEEEEKLKLNGFIDRLNKIDVESSEFLNKFLDQEEAVRLIEYLKERVQDPNVKTIWNVLENLPTNLDVQVDFEGIGLIAMVKERGLGVADSKSPKKVERFKVRTLDLGGVVVKDQDIVKK